MLDLLAAFLCYENFTGLLDPCLTALFSDAMRTGDTSEKRSVRLQDDAKVKPLELDLWLPCMSRDYLA